MLQKQIPWRQIQKTLRIKAVEFLDLQQEHQQRGVKRSRLHQMKAPRRIKGLQIYSILLSCGIIHLWWRTVSRDCLFCCSGVLTGPKQTQFKGVWPENSKKSLFIQLNCTIKKTISGKRHTLTCSFIKELPLIETMIFPLLLCLVCKVCLEAADISATIWSVWGESGDPWVIAEIVYHFIQKPYFIFYSNI